MKKRMCKIVSVIMSLALLTQCYPEAVSRVSASSNVKITVQYGQTEARSILAMINELRTGSDAWYWNADNTTKTDCTGIQPLVYDYELEKVAMQRAIEIAVSYDHQRPDGSRCFTAYDEYGYNWQNSCGENIAAGYKSASEVNYGWREDNENYGGQGHRRNMLNSKLTCVGIAHVKFNGCDYWVEEFSGNTPQSSETAAKEETEECEVRIDESRITSVELAASTEKISLRCNETYELSDISVQMGYTGYWNSRSKKTFKVNVTPEISSQNSNVATYSDGKVTGVSEGETALTATVYGKEASIVVSVHDCDLHKVVDKAVEATTNKTGLTEGSHCSVCNAVIEEQKVIPKLEKTPAPTEIPTPTPVSTVKPTETPEPTLTPTVKPTETETTPTVKPTERPISTTVPTLQSTETPDVDVPEESEETESIEDTDEPELVPEETPSGNQTIIPVPTDKEVIKASKNGVDYKVTSKNTVDITKVDKSKSRVEIPDVVTINRKQYKVTAIKAGAFKNCNKVSEIIIGKNIKSIDKNAFTGCKSLKRIYIKSTVVNKDDVKSALLAKINKKTTIVVPKSKYSAYKKLVINLGKRKKFIVLRK